MKISQCVCCTPNSQKNRIQWTVGNWQHPEVGRKLWSAATLKLGKVSRRNIHEAKVGSWMQYPNFTWFLRSFQTNSSFGCAYYFVKASKQVNFFSHGHSWGSCMDQWASSVGIPWAAPWRAHHQIFGTLAKRMRVTWKSLSYPIFLNQRRYYLSRLCYLLLLLLLCRS